MEMEMYHQTNMQGKGVVKACLGVFWGYETSTKLWTTLVEFLKSYHKGSDIPIEVVQTCHCNSKPVIYYWNGMFNTSSYSLHH